MLDLPDPLDLFQAYQSVSDTELKEGWLPGLYPGTVAGLIGDSTMGKSWLSLLLAHDWALDTHLTGMPIGRFGRIGYASLEDGRRLIRERLRVVSSKLTDAQQQRANEVIRIWDLSSWGTEDWKARRRHIVAMASQVDVLIIDHLRRLHALDENSNTEMSWLMGDLQVIAAQNNTTILTIHHVPTVPFGMPTKPLRARGAAVIRNTWRWCGGLIGRRDGLVDFVVLEARDGVASQTVLGSFRSGAARGIPEPVSTSEHPDIPAARRPESLRVIRFAQRL